MASYTVAHFRTPFLGFSETFIYGYLSHMNREVRPVVYTTARANGNMFPFQDVIDYSYPRFGLTWTANQIARAVGIRNWSLIRKLRAENARLIHAHFGEEGYELLSVKRQLGIPLITTFYGYDVSELGRIPEWRAKYQELFRDGDLFLVEGPFMKRSLAALGCPEEKIAIQHIAIPVSRIVFRERAPKAVGEKVIFLFCGRFVEKKGLIYALRAFDRVRREGLKNFEYRVIGDGPLADEAKNFVKDNGLEDNVNFLGRKTHSEFYDELQRADIFFSPSVTAANGDSEGGAPTTILEAQAAGLPILSSLHADIPRIVAEGKSALLSPERDDAALAANLRKLLTEQSLWKEMGKAGRRHVDENHNLAGETQKLEKFYLDLIKGKLEKNG